MLKLIVILLYLSKEAFDAFIDYLDSQYINKELPENVRDTKLMHSLPVKAMEMSLSLPLSG